MLLCSANDVIAPVLVNLVRVDLVFELQLEVCGIDAFPPKPPVCTTIRAFKRVLKRCHEVGFKIFTTTNDDLFSRSVVSCGESESDATFIVLLKLCERDLLANFEECITEHVLLRLPVNRVRHLKSGVANVAFPKVFCSICCLNNRIHVVSLLIKEIDRWLLWTGNEASKDIGSSLSRSFFTTRFSTTRFSTTSSSFSKVYHVGVGDCVKCGSLISVSRLVKQDTEVIVGIALFILQANVGDSSA